MKPGDLRIGAAFAGDGGLWHCTDVGTRTVLGIRLDEPSVLRNPTWLNGPPYAVVEHVFDERRLHALRLVPEEEVPEPVRPGRRPVARPRRTNIRLHLGQRPIGIWCPSPDRVRDFRIGAAFAMSGSLWRCTDVGTRTVLGVRLAGREAFPVSLQDNVWATRAVDWRRSPSRLAGPPYSVTEHVFCEGELDAIALVPEGDVSGWTPDRD